MGSPNNCETCPARARSPLRLIGALILLLVVAAPMLVACSTDPKAAATQNKSMLDSALHSATTAGVPVLRLAPIIAQEETLAANTATGTTSAYQAAADGYSKLYNQVTALEKMTPSQAQAQASGDLSTLQSSLTTADGSSIADVANAGKLFAPTVPQAQQQLAAAKTTKEYFTVDGYILMQLSAVTQLGTIYQQIQTLTKLVNTLTTTLGPSSGAPHVLECATEGGEIAGFGIVPAYVFVGQNDYPVLGTNLSMVTPQVQAQTFYFSNWPSQALTSYTTAQTAGDFTTLGLQVQSQIATLTADANPSVLAQEQIAAAVARFQDDVNTYQTDLQADNAFLKSHRAKNTDVPDYTTVWGLTQSKSGYGPPEDFYPDVPDFKLDSHFAQLATQDVSTLAQASTSSQFAALNKTLQQQEQALSFPLLQVKAYFDTDITLQNLVNLGDSATTNVTFAGVLYKTPNAYEYSDDNLRYNPADTVGIQDAQIRLAQSFYRENYGYDGPGDALADFTAVENEAQMFIHNLSANITNLNQMPDSNAARIAWSLTSHPADTNLINYYGLQNSRVIVVSLMEQKARLYQDGKMVVGSDGKPYAFDVTTGSPDKPSVPGLHCGLPPLKGPPGGDIFKSSDPKGSPFYYAPTPVHYSFSYSLYGYFMHDGWWRDGPNGTGEGYLTNLPHYDPIAFNGGSHGCINFHYANGDMGKVYAFSYPGIPILVY
jgi:hypothetical protein